MAGDPTGSPVLLRSAAIRAVCLCRGVSMVRKVLFVDDDQIMLLAVEKRFAAYADYFSMIMANDGFEAVQKLKETSISLIVLDLKMPRMDGMSLLSYIRDKYPDIPVIIVSGYRTAEMYKLAKARGVIAYISKPFQVDDLGKIIMSTLQKEADGGIMHNVSPTVFLQLMEMEAKTCTIRILDKKSGKGGILYFEDGNLLDARVGEIQGLDAAYRVFTWEEVTIFIQNECAPRENTINSELQPIIMKAVGMKDEEEDPLPPDGSDESSLDITEAEEELRSALQDELGSLDLPEEFFEIEDEEALDSTPASIAPSTPESATAESSLSEPSKPGSQRAVSNQTSPEPKTAEHKAAELKQEKSQIEISREVVHSEVGPRSGLEDIYADDSMKNVVDFLSELGSMFDFGKLKVGYIDNGKEFDRIIIPGNPPTVLTVNQKCPQEKMLQVLSRYS